MTADLNTIARETFSDDKFVHVPDVPVFCEHERKGSDGTTRKYTRRELEEIVQKCNQRILDTNDFAALTEGHTPDKDDLIKGAKQPRVLGFSGPFKLGKIGRPGKQRYAIFTDEWHFKEDHDEMKRRPRRSVELWIGDKVFDPIATLGAETPHLDLGLTRFFRLPSGQQVEKYMAAMPSGDNTFIPSDKEQYDMAASPELVAQVLEAVQQLPALQWISQKMAEEESVQQPTQPEQPSQPYQEDEEEEPKEDYEAGDDCQPPKQEPDKMAKNKDLETVTKYRKMEAENNDLKERFAKQEERVLKMERRASDAERERIIEQLGRDFLIDVEEEKKLCLYSRDSEMTDDQFDAHRETVVKYAQPNIEGRTLPAGEMPPAARESYEKEANEVDMIVNYQQAKDAAGEHIDYQQARNELVANGQIQAG